MKHPLFTLFLFVFVILFSGNTFAQQQLRNHGGHGNDAKRGRNVTTADLTRNQTGIDTRNTTDNRPGPGKVYDPKTRRYISLEEQAQKFPQRKLREQLLPLRDGRKNNTGHSTGNGHLKSQSPLLPYNASGPHLWGTTTDGGDGAGTVFAMNTGDSLLDYQHTFPFMPGILPESPLFKASDGKFYGTTFRGGGRFDYGTLYRFDPVTNKGTMLYAFDSYEVGRDAYVQLLEATPGELYGVCYYNDNGYHGSIYKWNIADSTITRLQLFDGIHGEHPTSALIKGSDGFLYGTTRDGGQYGKGTIYRFNLSDNSITDIHDFNDSNGTYPSELTQASNGKIYGVGGQGGSLNIGVLFELDPATDIYTIRYNFDTLHGIQPYTKLVEMNGKLYGVSSNGGLTDTYGNHLGIIFAYDILTQNLNTVFSFDSVNGAFPNTSLIKTSNGKVYGTEGGYWPDRGKIYEFHPTTNTITYVKTFEENDPVYVPSYPFVEGNDGKLYDIQYSGGSSGAGLLFSYDFGSNSFAVRLTFGATPEGAMPMGTLVQGLTTKLYGVATIGGLYGDYSGGGVIYEIDPSNGAYTVKHNFNINEDYESPQTELIRAKNGKLYGIASGGASGNGTLYEYDPVTDTYTGIYDFQTSLAENWNELTLMQSGNGKLYGINQSGGEDEDGSIFQYDFATGYSEIYSFTNSTGRDPIGKLLEVGNGKLYGITQGGGDNGDGVVYSINLDGSDYQKLIDLDDYSATGSEPLTGLTLGPDGKIYGMGSYGGSAYYGSLFSFDTTGNTPVELYSFTGYADGGYPNGLLVANNGLFYGTTYTYGDALYDDYYNTGGVVFEYNTSTSTMTKKFTFTQSTGRHPSGISEVLPPVTLTTNGANGSVSNNFNQSNFVKGTSVILTATANSHYHFANWTGDLTSTKNPDTLVMDANKSVTAHFALNSYTITINGTHGTATKTPNLANYTWGSYVKLTAQPDAGYHFAAWTGDASGTVDTVTILVDGDKTVTPTFAINLYTITPTYAPYGHGFTTPSTPQSVQYLGSASFAVTAGFGYHTDSIVVDGVRTDSLTGYTFTNVTAAHAIAAYASLNKYTLSITSAYGTVYKTPDKNTYIHGDTVILSAVPNANYLFYYWGGQSPTVYMSQKNPDTMVMNSSKNIIANYYSDSLYIIVTQNSNGTISPGTCKVKSGGSKTFTITPNDGYVIDKVLVNGVNVGTQPVYAFSNVTNTRTISATFKVGTQVPSTFVLGPNGPEAWVVGDTRSITWQSYGINKVRITLQSGGSSYLIADSVSSSGVSAYSWVIPSIKTMFPASTATSIQARVKITSVGTSGVKDSSDANFIIKTPIFSSFTGTTNRLTGVSFLGKTGYSVGNAGTVIKTTDGGATWTDIGTFSFPTTTNFRGVSVSSDGNVYIISGSGDNYASLYRSTNAGLSWDVQQTFQNNDVRAISTLDDNIFVVGDGGFIFWKKGAFTKTINSNKPLERFTSIVTFGYRQHDNNNEPQVVSRIVGTNGTFLNVVVTENTGATSVSNAGYIGTSQTLSGVFFLDLGTGWVVGNGGTILRTVNAATSWTTQASGTAQNLNAITMITSPTGTVSGWIVGDGGYLAKYTPNLTKNKWRTGVQTEGNNDWTQVESGTTDDLTTATITDNGSFVSLGDSGTALNSQAENLFLTSPIGGEIYLGGATVPITWANDGVNNVKIEYSADSGQTWQSVTNFISADAGRYDWTTPNSSIQNALVAVTSIDDSTLVVTSESVFHIVVDNQAYRTFKESVTDFTAKTVKMAYKKGKLVAQPNILTALENVFAKQVPKAGITILGLKQTQKDSIKKYAWIDVKKAADIAAGFKTAHTGTSYPLDYLRKGDKKTKLSKAVKFTTASNPAIAEAILLKLNILASDTGITPRGFGDLEVDTNIVLAGRNLNGQSLSEVSTFLDTVMTFWKAYGIDTTDDYTELGNVASLLKSINDGFYSAMSVGNYTVDSGAVVAKVKQPYAVTLSGSATAAQVGIVKRSLSARTRGRLFTAETETPAAYHLSQNYPNPFNPLTVIGYSLSVNSIVSLKVYDVLGREVATLVNNETMNAGEYEISFNASSLSSGVYFYRLTAKNETGKVFTQAKKLVLIR